MFSIRTSRAVAAVMTAAACLAAASCSSASDSGATAPAGRSTDLGALLGPSNVATGAPIKIGLVHDGKTVGIDHTPNVDAFHATVQYANEHLGGLNGHKIEVEECSTNNTPSDATNCGVQMVQDGVAAVLVPVSAQDAAVYKAISGSGIPYITYAAGAPEIIAAQDAFLLANPIATLAAPAKIANQNGVKKAGIIIIDVPAATAPLKSIAEPLYTKSGVELSLIPISPQTADMTPQIQQAIGDGVQQFSVIGTDEFNAQGIKTLKQLGYDGKIIMVTAPTKAVVDNVGDGGLDGVIYLTSATSDPKDADVQLYDAVMQTYAEDTTPTAQSAWSFALLMATINALKGADAAVDGPSIAKAISSMPTPLPLPLGAGLNYRCGAKVVSFLPSVCTDNALSTTLDAQGNGQSYQKLDVSEYMTMG